MIDIVSPLFYIRKTQAFVVANGVHMSFEEKGTWVYVVIAATLAVVYFAIVLGQLPQTPAGEIEFQLPLLVVIGRAIGLTIAAYIAIGIAAPDDAGKSDQRDKDINRYGEYVGGLVLGVAAIVPFVLALAEADHFWIANTIYLAFVLSTIAGSIVKIVAYRRGF
jgi:hypothetical protein